MLKKSLDLEDMDDELNICLACGLCCDGTLIGFVQLESEEMPALKKIMDVEDENGHGFFLHPCDKYCNGCTIYEDRPKQCDKFKCKLLSAVTQNEIEFNKAVEYVAEVKLKKAVILKNIALLELDLMSPSFYFQIVELKKILKKNESSLTQIQQELVKDISELDLLLLKEFGVSLN
jgi:uncharacterized protein